MSYFMSEDEWFAFYLGGLLITTPVLVGVLLITLNVLRNREVEFCEANGGLMSSEHVCMEIKTGLEIPLRKDDR
jgi:hypothetical protein